MGHDREAYAVDATHVRVHAHGTRARGSYAAQAVGRSRGGFTSKVHLLVDALGYPVRFVITGGERNDVTQAPALLTEHLQMRSPVAVSQYVSAFRHHLSSDKSILEQRTENLNPVPLCPP